MHPLAAPGTLWVLSSDGKYLVRPQADETSHKEQISCARQGKGPILLFPYHKEFRLCGGDQRAFRSPIGNLRAPSCARDVPQEIDFLRKGKSLPYFFPQHRRFRLSGGDQGAFRSFRNLNRRGVPPLVSVEKGRHAQPPLAAMPAFPPGPLRGPSLYAWAKPATRNPFLVAGIKKACLSPCSPRGPISKT